MRRREVKTSAGSIRSAVRCGALLGAASGALLGLEAWLVTLYRLPKDMPEWAAGAASMLAGVSVTATCTLLTALSFGAAEWLVERLWPHSGCAKRRPNW
jgi:hypothetical protein